MVPSHVPQDKSTPFAFVIRLLIQLKAAIRVVFIPLASIYAMLSQQSKLILKVGLALFSVYFLYTKEAYFMGIVSRPITETITDLTTSEATVYVPIGATPFMDARERVIILTASRIGKRPTDAHFRNEVGHLYDSVATIKVQSGLDAVRAQFEAAKCFGVKLDEGFLSHTWEGKPILKEKPQIKPKSKPSNKGKNDWGMNASRDQLAPAYIEKYAAVAIAEMHKFKIPASVILAQGLVESGSGTSRLAREANNHFGMKCFSKKCRTGHCIRATDDSHKDFFRKYPSAWESFRAHSQLLHAPHYQCIKTGKTPKLKGEDAKEKWALAKQHWNTPYKRYAYGLDAVGYATTNSYATKLIEVVERHKLYKYDSQ
jgi:flagellum-specific peptidoglycan hydrolase FlgJ